MLVLLASCGPNKHVNAWDRQSSALDPVGITSKKMAAKNKAEQAFYKPGEAVTFKKDRMMVFEQNPESNFSTSGTVRGGVKTGKVLVCGDLFAKVEFEDGSQGYVSLSEIVNPQEMMGFYPVSASDLIGPDGALLPLPSNMGAVSPEAAAGGPIALVEPDDLSQIDVHTRKLAIVGVKGEPKTPEEMDAILAERRANWKPKAPKYTKGLLKLYSQHAVSPMKGAYME